MTAPTQPTQPIPSGPWQPTADPGEVTPETAGVGDDLVAHAVHALGLFGVCTLREAKILLSMWARRDELTDVQVDEVLAYYQPVMAPPQRWSVTSGGVAVES